MSGKQPPSEQNGVKPVKVTFYLTPEQSSKLDDLVYLYKKQTRKSVNRNDIVRLLIDHCTLELLAKLDGNS